MKLKLFDKVMLVLLILLGIVLLGGLIFACWSTFFAHDITSFALAVLVGPVINRVIITAVSVLFIFLMLRILFVRKRDTAAAKTEQDQQQNDSMADSGQIRIKTSEFGESYITTDALHDMVQKIVRGNNSVRDANSSVSSEPQSGRIHARVEILPLPDTNLPELSDELQKNVKELLAERTGIVLEDVQIVFVNQPQNTMNTGRAPLR